MNMSTYNKTITNLSVRLDRPQQSYSRMQIRVGEVVKSLVLLTSIDEALPLDFSSIKNLAIFGSDAGANPDGANSCAGMCFSNHSVRNGDESTIIRSRLRPGYIGSWMGSVLLMKWESKRSVTNTLQEVERQTSPILSHVSLNS